MKLSPKQEYVLSVGIVIVFTLTMMYLTRPF